MFNFNRILNRKTDSDKITSPSENLLNLQEEVESKSVVSGDEGFLCPTCLAKFPNAEVLQNHYETNHSSKLAVGDTGRVSCVCSVCKMVLGSDIELKSHYQRHHSSSEKAELDALQMRTKVLEEGKNILHTELETLYKQLSDQIRSTSLITAQKMELEQENDKMAQLITSLKAECSELKIQNVTVNTHLQNAEEKVRLLEQGIEQRIEADNEQLMAQCASFSFHERLNLVCEKLSHLKEVYNYSTKELTGAVINVPAAIRHEDQLEERQIEEPNTQNEDFSVEIETLVNQIKEVNVELQEISTLKMKNGVLQNQLTAVKSEVDKAKHELQELQRNLTVVLPSCHRNLTFVQGENERLKNMTTNMVDIFRKFVNDVTQQLNILHVQYQLSLSSNQNMIEYFQKLVQSILIPDFEVDPYTGEDTDIRAHENFFRNLIADVKQALQNQDNEISLSKVMIQEKEVKLRNVLEKLMQTEILLQEESLVKSEFEKMKCDLENKVAECNKQITIITRDAKEKENEYNLVTQLQNDFKSKIQKLELETKSLVASEKKLILEKEEFCKLSTAHHEALEMKIKQCNELDSLVKELQSQCHTERNSANKIKQDLDAAKQLLVESNKHFEKEKQSLTERHCKATSELNSKITTLEDSSLKLNDSNAAMQCQMTKLQEQLNKSVSDSTAAENLFTSQIQLLDENVAALKSALQSEEAKQIESKDKVDDLSGIKLELEAKLENTLEERKALLARCLSSEADNEKLREKSIELRKKLDDSIAALQELGRENQTLQLEIAKFCERKWADDAEVANCTSCEKVFSVTIRKHHCRNCGKIFCNECSSKSAAIAAWKNPVRVCSQCYDEIVK